MSDLPEQIRKELKGFLSKQTDETIDLFINLVGKPISEEQRNKIKQQFELKEAPKIEDSISRTYRIGLRLQKEYQQKGFEKSSFKDKFYLMTDTFMKLNIPGIPTHVHAMDYLLQTSEELVRNFRFPWHYLVGTRYDDYLQALEQLMSELKKKNKINMSLEISTEFRASKDFYLLLQATLQKLIKYYEFLEKDFPQIEKKQVDMYLEIYEELSGHYEKFIALIAALIRLSETNVKPKYETARSRSISRNMLYVERSGWSIFVSGFNRNMRNAIAHKTLSVDIVKQAVELIDRKKILTMTFKEVQKETRELSSLLLVLPHVLISIYGWMLLSVREMLDSFSD